MGWMIQWVAITWMMVEIDGRPVMVGLVQTCLSIPVIFFAMPAGALSDLFGRKARGTLDFLESD
jgi:MFS family permease